MIYFHDLDPVALALGDRFAIHWYGIMYLLGFGVAWWLGIRRVERGRLPVTKQAFENLAFGVFLGVILGGRLGYMLFYGWNQWLEDPAAILRVWEGGMSFHGGLIGVLIAVVVWSARNQLRFWDTIDFVAPLVPPGLFAGRMGNWIGGELWGAKTGGDWGVIFPAAVDPNASIATLRELYLAGALDAHARHPSQLYEAVLKGLVMFAILFWYSSKPRRRYAVSGLFALLYGVFRTAVEFVREPDAHIGHLFGGWFTMGMALSVPLIVIGVALLLKSRGQPTVVPPEPRGAEAG